MRERPPRGHYVAVARLRCGIEIDRGREHFDVGAPFDSLIGAVDDVADLLEGFSDADAGTWCEVTIEATLRSGAEEFHRSVIWSSFDPSLGALFPAELHAAARSSGGIDHLALARLLAAQVRIGALRAGGGAVLTPPGTGFRLAETT